LDKCKVRLDNKGTEKKNSMKDDFGDDDEGQGGQEEIIDEEELMLLREMKDLKKNYRDNYDRLKNVKVEI
jgi:hypothetical protein